MNVSKMEKVTKQWLHEEEKLKEPMTVGGIHSISSTEASSQMSPL